MHSAVFWCFIPLQEKRKLGTAPLKNLNDTAIKLWSRYFSPPMLSLKNLIRISHYNVSV